MRRHVSREWRISQQCVLYAKNKVPELLRTKALPEQENAMRALLRSLVATGDALDNEAVALRVANHNAAVVSLFLCVSI